MKNIFSTHLLISLLLTLPIDLLFNEYQQKDFVGKVIAITDGDTIKVLDKDKTMVRVRVANIDCPERKQPFSKRAKQFTSDAVFGKQVDIKVLKQTAMADWWPTLSRMIISSSVKNYLKLGLHGIIKNIPIMIVFRNWKIWHESKS
jgi:hypothetical protein